jgi:hypothetical protein
MDLGLNAMLSTVDPDRPLTQQCQSPETGTFVCTGMYTLMDILTAVDFQKGRGHSHFSLSSKITLDMTGEHILKAEGIH